MIQHRQVGKLLQQHNVLGAIAGRVAQQVDDDVAQTSVLLWQLERHGIRNSLQPFQLTGGSLGRKTETTNRPLAVCILDC